MKNSEEDGVVWFDPFVWFGALLGALSFSHLVSKAYDIGFGPVLSGLLGTYEAALARVALVFEPFIHQVLDAFYALFDWRLDLHPHWKHVFVLLTVYFAARYTSAFKRKQWGAAWLMVVVGVICASFAGVGAGVVPLSSEPGELRMNIVAMTVFPTVGILVFDLAEIVWTSLRRLEEMRKAVGNPSLTTNQAFMILLRNVAARCGGALTIIAIVVGVSYLPLGLENVPSPGLTLLLILSALMGVYWLYQGAITAGNRKQEGETWRRAFVRIGSTRVGWAIIRYMLLGTMTVVVGWWLWDAHGLG